MKFSNALLSTFIICNLGIVLASDTFADPISSIVRQNYNLTYDELQTKCAQKGSYLLNEIYQVISESIHDLSEVSKDIVKEARKKATDSSVNWNQLIDEICLPNVTFRKNSKSVVDIVQKCLDEKDQLSEERKAEVQENLRQKICENVKVLAQFHYTAGEPGNPDE